MFPEERQKYILDRLKLEGSVKSDDLAEALQVSTMTIYRDLDLLEEQGLIKRKYGGAILDFDLLEEKSRSEKSILNIDSKNKIAQAALDLIQDGEVIFLDAGTTNYQLALLIAQKGFHNLKIITNDLKIAMFFGEKKAYETIIIGGKIDSRGLLTSGYLAANFLKQFSISKAFIGTQALAKDFSITTTKEEKIDYKNYLIKESTRSILLMDQEKFQQKRLYHINDLQWMDVVITDQSFPSLKDYCQKENIKLIIV